MGHKKPPKKPPPNTTPTPLPTKPPKNLEPSSSRSVSSDPESTPPLIKSLTVASSKVDETKQSSKHTASATDLVTSLPGAEERDEPQTQPNSLPPVKEKESERVQTAQDEEIKSPLTGKNSWADLVKGTQKPLRKKGKAFTLESGEACVQIPNAVIERNSKAWDCFVLGQFYSSPPSQGVIHNIVNGIWSKAYRDVVVSRVEGNAFLFRIPNPSTRSRVLTQRLWQIQGQTMFVAKWEPGFRPVKPELSSSPIWIELREVPLQFFNEEGLEHIAGLVGEPKLLHPSTANKTNLEVAKVLTMIDPRVPLPEAVNVKFESGEIKRIRVSSPWMPPICSFCKDIGHSIKHCQKAPITCLNCDSKSHLSDACTRVKNILKKGADYHAKPQTMSPDKLMSEKQEWVQKDKEKEKGIETLSKRRGKEIVEDPCPDKPKHGISNHKRRENISGKVSAETTQQRPYSGIIIREPRFEEVAVESDSSDVSSTELEEGEYQEVLTRREEGEYQEVLTRREKKKARGRSLKQLH